MALWPAVPAHLLLFIVLFLFAKLIRDIVTPYSLDHELTQKDNLALSNSFAGYLFAVLIIYLGALLGPETQGSLLTSLTETGSYSLIGILLLNLSWLVNDKLILYRFSNETEIIKKHNSAVGIVQGGAFIATGCVLAGAVHGEGGGILSFLVFYVLGQLALVICAAIYNLLAPFDVHQQILKKNKAAGTALAGSLIGLGIILMKGASGDFISWTINLENFVFDSLLALLLLPIFRLIFDKLIIFHADLNHEIVKDKNLGAGILELTVTVSFSILLSLLI